MGPSYSKSTSESVQQTRLYQSQVLDNKCQTNVVQGIENITIKLNNVEIKGSIEVAQQADVDVNCVFNNNITSVAEKVLDAYSSNEANADKQRGLAGLLNLVSIEITDSTTVQDVETEIRQTIENVCHTTVDNSIRNIEMAFIESSIGENVIITQNADVTSECIVSNLAKLETQLDLEVEQNNQTGKSRNFLTYLAIAGVLFVIIMIVISLVFGWSKGKKKKDCTETPSECQGKSGVNLEDCLLALPPPDMPFCDLPPPGGDDITTDTYQDDYISDDYNGDFD